MEALELIKSEVRGGFACCGVNDAHLAFERSSGRVGANYLQGAELRFILPLFLLRVPDSVSGIGVFVILGIYGKVSGGAIGGRQSLVCLGVYGFVVLELVVAGAGIFHLAPGLLLGGFTGGPGIGTDISVSVHGIRKGTGHGIGRTVPSGRRAAAVKLIVVIAGADGHARHALQLADGTLGLGRDSGRGYYQYGK